ncbi:hypothetical protein OROGR_012437 [Orobanche gracilis]
MADNEKSRLLARSMSHALDELRGFRTWLRWLCVDQSNYWTATLSWLVFLGLAIVVPALSHFVLACAADCVDSRHSRPYDTVAQMSLSGVAALSFVCLSGFVRRYGLRRFLFFDKLCDESETVRKGYTKQFTRSMKLLFIFVLPCNAIILRLQDFAQVFMSDSDVESVLREHLRIRRHLRIISHRFRLFILWALVFITASQFASLLMTTKSNADVNIFHTGELAVCSVSLLTGLLIILRSATRITHKAQAVTCLAAKWHVCATIDSFDTSEAETPIARIADKQFFSGSSDGSSDSDDVGDEEDELDNSKFVPSYAHSTISFQKRQALGTQLQYVLELQIGITTITTLEPKFWDYGIRIHAGSNFSSYDIRYRNVFGAMAAGEDDRHFLNSSSELEKRNCYGYGSEYSLSDIGDGEPQMDAYLCSVYVKKLKGVKGENFFILHFLGVICNYHFL